MIKDNQTKIWRTKASIGLVERLGKMDSMLIPNIPTLEGHVGYLIKT